MTRATLRGVRRAIGLGFVFSSVSFTVVMALFFWPRRDQMMPSSWAWRDGHLLCLPPTSAGLAALAHFLGVFWPCLLMFCLALPLGLWLAGSPQRWFMSLAASGGSGPGAV